MKWNERKEKSTERKERFRKKKIKKEMNRERKKKIRLKENANLSCQLCKKLQIMSGGYCRRFLGQPMSLK